MNLEEYYRSLEPLFGAWTLREKIGQGTFGQVYRIERENFDAVYQSAMKAITIPQDPSEVQEIRNQGMDEKSTTAYFKGVVSELVKEFNLMEKLKGQTNIVSYEDHCVIEHADEMGWDVLIRMELLVPFSSWLQGRSITAQDVVRVGADLCKALVVCGKFGIVHRDIKPANVFVSNTGDFKLGDFGIARTMEKTKGSFSQKGTYEYMAPEINRGAEYDARVDIYSLGMVLYRLLNDNRMPFLPAAPQPITFSDREKALFQRFGGSPLPRPAHGPEALLQVVLKACAFSPSERYCTPEEMLQDLQLLAETPEERWGDLRLIFPKTKETLQQGTSQARAVVLQKDAGNVQREPWEAAQEGTVSVFAPRTGNNGEERLAPEKPSKTSQKSKMGRVLAICVLIVVLGAGAIFVGTKLNTSPGEASVTQAGALTKKEMEDAYQQGIDLLQQNDYTGAIAALSQVGEKSSVYADAMTALEKAKEAYCEQALAAADVACAKSDYIGAQKEITNAKAVLGADERLIQKEKEIGVEKIRTEYLSLKQEGQTLAMIQLLQNAPEEVSMDADLAAALETETQAYVEEVTQKAAQIYAEEDYSAAVLYVQQEANNLPENAALADLIEQYKSKKPQYVREMKIFSQHGNWYQYNTAEDAYGAEHAQALSASYTSSTTEEKNYVEYYTEGKYQYIQGWAVAGKDYAMENYGVLKIYADDVLVYTSENIGLRTEPVRFNVAINNAKYVRFAVTGNADYYTPETLIVYDAAFVA